MPIKKFYVKSNGEVMDVGLRSSLIALTLDYDLKVAPRNLYEENKVQVIVKGRDEDIQRFWEHVKKHDIRPRKIGGPYTVSEIEPYEAEEPDWVYHTSASVMEQISKGVTTLDSIDTTLKGMGGTLKGMKGTLKGMGSTLKGIDKKFDKLPERIAEALGARKSK